MVSFNCVCVVICIRFVLSKSHMFVGVEFTKEDGGGVALVHRKWMTPRKNEIWWPPFKQQDVFDRSLKKGESPNENWKLFGVSKSFFEEDDYKKALQKLRKAEFTSDITTSEAYSSSDNEETSHSPPPKVRGIPQFMKKKLGESSSTKSSQHVIETELDYQDNTHSIIVHQENTRELQQDDIPQQPPSTLAERDLKKILNYLVLLKNQNSEILHLLKQSKSASGKHLELPQNLPVSLPLKNARDLKLFEEYLLENDNLFLMVSYLSTL